MPYPDLSLNTSFHFHSGTSSQNSAGETNVVSQVAFTTLYSKYRCVTYATLKAIIIPHAKK